MKKIAVIILCLILSITTKTYALSPSNLSGDKDGVQISGIYNMSDISVYNGFKYVTDMLEAYNLKQYRDSRSKKIWTVSSLDKHRKLQYRIFEDKSSDTYEKMVKTIDKEIDFIQFATLIDKDLLETVRKSFEKDVAKATVETILPPNQENKKQYYKYLKNSDIPIYWNIQESNTNVFTLEVAVGKYVIQPGDTLSEIARRYNTAVSKLLEDNKNIENPDLIYAYDYLVIK